MQLIKDLMEFKHWIKNRFPSLATETATEMLRLRDEGASLAYIADYRPDLTGDMDPWALYEFFEACQEWQRLRERKQFILDAIEKQKKSSEALRAQIEEEFRPEILEDLFLPYKSKPKSPAHAAREAGLAPLAEWIWECAKGLRSPEAGQTLELWAFTFRNDAAGVPDAAVALAGAKEILAENLAERLDLRAKVRARLSERAALKVLPAPGAKHPERYAKLAPRAYAPEECLDPSFAERYFVLRRGGAEGDLLLDLGTPEALDLAPEALDPLQEESLPEFLAEVSGGDFARDYLAEVARSALLDYAWPSLRQEFFLKIKRQAEQILLRALAERARQRLLAAPFGPKVVMGVEPSLRSGIKLAVVDASGQYLVGITVLLESEEDRVTSEKIFSELIALAKIEAIAVADEPGAREVVGFLQGLLKKLGQEALAFEIVSGIGAHSYAASAEAKEEFASLDPGIKAAISVARRFQDPLRELSQVESKSLAEGPYQHEAGQAQLRRILEFTQNFWRHRVGLELNSAKASELGAISGLNAELAQAIVQYRAEQGPFRRRDQLLQVPGLTEERYRLAAPFLRILDGEQPLDATAVAPEHYPAVEAMAQRLGKSLAEILSSGLGNIAEDAQLSQDLGAPLAFRVLEFLEQGSRDPRDPWQSHNLRSDLSWDQLQIGEWYPAWVTHATHYGIFVDLGVGQESMIHLSELPRALIRDPRQWYSLGDFIEVRLLAIDSEQKKLNLSLRPPPQPRPERRAPEANRRDRGARPSRDKKPRSKVVFNDAFAALAELKSKLKPKG